MTPDVPCFAPTPSVLSLFQRALCSSSPQTPQPFPPSFDQTHAANQCIFFPSQQADSSCSQAPDLMTPRVPCFALTLSACYLFQYSNCSPAPQIPLWFD